MLAETFNNCICFLFGGGTTFQRYCIVNIGGGAGVISCAGDRSVHVYFFYSGVQYLSEVIEGVPISAGRWDGGYFILMVFVVGFGQGGPFFVGESDSESGVEGDDGLILFLEDNEGE